MAGSGRRTAYAYGIATGSTPQALEEMTKNDPTVKIAKYCTRLDYIVPFLFVRMFPNPSHNHVLRLRGSA